MKLLAQQIESALLTQKQCFVRPDELQRVWPHASEAEREHRARDFAQQHGWQIFTYTRALGAMFVRARK